MFELSLIRKIELIIGLPLYVLLKKIDQDEDLSNFSYKIIISDKKNINFNEEQVSDENNSNLNEIQFIIENNNDLISLSKLQDFNKIKNLRVINAKKEENIIKIYVAKEVHKLIEY